MANLTKLADPYEVNPDADFLLPCESRALRRMVAKALDYQNQGRAREAWGARRMIGILWAELSGLDESGSQYMGLENV